MKKCIIYFVPDYDENNRVHENVRSWVYEKKGFSSIHTESPNQINWMLKHVQDYFDKKDSSKDHLKKIIEDLENVFRTL